MRTLPAFPLAFAFALGLAGCVAPSTRSPVAPVPTPPPVPAEAAPATYTPPCATTPTTPEAAFDCDRKSILAMAGEFRVRFAFDETAALAAGYAPRDPQRSGGSELVVVIEDTGRRISLQHILVLGKEHTVVKHWRQDWQFEPTQRLRFRGLGRFETQAVATTDAAGTWSQTVYEVDDAPRYAGIGRWVHAGGENAWESDRSWRPLPRREYTKRSDYQAIDAVNRHALTPAGWIHEQDNTKLAIAGDGSVRALARERGLNTYTRITDYDFTAGRDYWRKTVGYWADVRAEWARYETTHPHFTTSPEPNGEPRIEEFFKLAERAEQGGQVAPEEIRALFSTYMKPVPEAPSRRPAARAPGADRGGLFLDSVPTGDSPMLKSLLSLVLSAGALGAHAADCSVDLEATDMMQFNKSEIAIAKACKDFTINLKHPGAMAKNVMGHNVVIARSADVQAVASDGAGAGLEQNYVKAGDTRVIAHSKVIGAGETTSVTFPVSKLEGGENAFFCSYPGHYSIMRGRLIVG